MFFFWGRGGRREGGCFSISFGGRGGGQGDKVAFWVLFLLGGGNRFFVWLLFGGIRFGSVPWGSTHLLMGFGNLRILFSVWRSDFDRPFKGTLLRRFCKGHPQQKPLYNQPTPLGSNFCRFPLKRNSLETLFETNRFHNCSSRIVQFPPAPRPRSRHLNSLRL